MDCMNMLRMPGGPALPCVVNMLTQVALTSVNYKREHAVRYGLFSPVCIWAKPFSAL